MSGPDLPLALSRAVTEAAECLKSGGVVAYPTDTVYGLGALAGDELAVRKLYRIKGREFDKPLPLLIASSADVDAVATGLSEEAITLIDGFWPGGLTLVLRRRRTFHSVALQGDTVAVRVPGLALTRYLIELAGEPVTGTSANRSGEESCRTAEEVRAQLADDVDFILDGGACPGGIESTVLDCTTESLRILRQGAVPVTELEKALGRSLGD
jgi:L-threonylcarbamoyladenylate synthase